MNKNGTWFHADYDTFSLDSEDDYYAISVSGFSGTAGDSLTNTVVDAKWYHNGMNFSTFDANRKPGSNCAKMYEGGWWFNNCYLNCLTCRYGLRFVWETSKTKPSTGIVQEARMMIKSK